MMNSDQIKNKQLFSGMLSILSIVLIVILFTSCDGFQEQQVDLNISVDDVPRILVVNGEIEENNPVWVQVSYSEDINAALGTPVNYEELAFVTLSSSIGENEVLAYSGYGVYSGSSIHGEVNRTYTINIDIDGRIFSASSTMLPSRGYQNAWVTEDNGSYSDEWVINDPSDERNRYLFEWWSNGVHFVRQDWCIDDNRVVNANEGLRLFTVTLNPGPNEYIRHRTAEVDKLTYDYFNMYEKIMRGMVGADSQTPYNPVSNLGQGTIGNFRAVAFASSVVLTPPNITVNGDSTHVLLSFELNAFFTKYNLYWSHEPRVTDQSNIIEDFEFTVSGSQGKFSHDDLSYGSTYYYRIQVEDDEGNVSVLSPEYSALIEANSGSLSGITNLIATAGDGQITISWDDVSGADAYYIYWDTSSGVDETSKVIYKDGLTSPYKHTDLTSGQTYFYRVVAKVGNDKLMSDEVSATAN